MVKLLEREELTFYKSQLEHAKDQGANYIAVGVDFLESVLKDLDPIVKGGEIMNVENGVYETTKLISEWREGQEGAKL